MKEQKLEKVVEWNINVYSFYLACIYILIVGIFLGYISNSKIELIIFFIIISLIIFGTMKSEGYNFRKVYWRKI